VAEGVGRMALFNRLMRLTAFKTVIRASNAVIYAGIGPETQLIIARRLILFNVVMLIGSLTYASFIFVYLSFDEEATRQCAVFATSGMVLSIGSYFLLTRGYRFIGRTIFTLTAVVVIISSNYILGTKAVSQPLFFAVGVGFIVIWQDLRKETLILIEIILGFLFGCVIFDAPIDPMFAREMSPDTVHALRIVHFSLSYITCFAFVFYTFFFAERAEKLLNKERLKSEDLLLNILPESVVKKLKIIPEKSIADRFEQVTVLFADIVGFTALTEKVRPEEVVSFLEEVFRSFDQIVEKNRVEKIKTIGDSYMIVSGAPEHRTDHAHAAAATAIDMIQAASKIIGPDGNPVRIRVGLHSGPVVAGVISFKKFSYDVWGDTVNIASRMESHGVPSMIHASPTTYEILKEDFIFEPRGRIEIKGGRIIDSWWLLHARDCDTL